jgi:hypothetical protein
LLPIQQLIRRSCPASGASCEHAFPTRSFIGGDRIETRRVTRWRTSNQKLRCRAAARRATEKPCRRVKNYRHLPLLKQALQTTLTTTNSAAA